MLSEFGEQEWERYRAAMHAVQSGVGVKMNLDPHETEAKHLRVGVNAAMVHEWALVRLLVAKGILTEDEHLTAIADEAEREQQRYEQELTARFGKPITLG